MQKTVIALIFATYACFGVLLEYFIHGEIYPVFSWSLFSVIPNPTVDTTIRVHEMHGKQYEPPLTFQDLTFLFTEIGHSPTQYTPIIKRLGDAIKDDNQEKIDKERAHLEALFGTMPFRYDVVRITYDPIVFFSTHTPEDERIIASFTDSQ